MISNSGTMLQSKIDVGFGEGLFEKSYLIIIPDNLE